MKISFPFGKYAGFYLIALAFTVLQLGTYMEIPKLIYSGYLFSPAAFGFLRFWIILSNIVAGIAVLGYVLHDKLKN